MCIEKESPQHQRQGNNCHIDADAIFTLTCCLRKASALVQMHPPIPPLPSLKVSRQRSHPSRNAAALVASVSMSINATLTCCPSNASLEHGRTSRCLHLHHHRRPEIAGGYMYVPGESREIPPCRQGSHTCYVDRQAGLMVRVVCRQRSYRYQRNRRYSSTTVHAQYLPRVRRRATCTT